MINVEHAQHIEKLIQQWLEANQLAIIALGCIPPCGWDFNKALAEHIADHTVAAE